MALRPQTSPGLQELLALGVVRTGTDGELYKPDGTVLNPNGLQKAALVPNAAGGTVTGAEFNALIAAMKAAGLMSTT